MPIGAIAQLGERQTEDLEVPSSILGHGIFAQVGRKLRCIASPLFHQVAMYMEWLHECRNKPKRFCTSMYGVDHWVNCAETEGEQRIRGARASSKLPAKMAFSNPGHLHLWVRQV